MNSPERVITARDRTECACADRVPKVRWTGDSWCGNAITNRTARLLSPQAAGATPRGHPPVRLSCSREVRVEGWNRSGRGGRQGAVHFLPFR
jgi:hypothetical protein